MSVSEYLRPRALDVRLVTRVDVDALAELRRQGGLIKHLATLDRSHAYELRVALNLIHEVIRRLLGDAKVPRKRRDGRSTVCSLLAYIRQSASSLSYGEAIWSADKAWSEMQHVAQANARCKDPVYHYILSWPSADAPSDDQVHEVVGATLSELGLLDHQWVGAVQAQVLRSEYIQ